MSSQPSLAEMIYTVQTEARIMSYGFVEKVVPDFVIRQTEPTHKRRFWRFKRRPYIKLWHVPKLGEQVWIGSDGVLYKGYGQLPLGEGGALVTQRWRPLDLTAFSYDELDHMRAAMDRIQFHNQHLR